MKINYNKIFAKLNLLKLYKERTVCRFAYKFA